jgi:glycosyltransferase involved in cell wall biosynthesis
MKRKLLRFIKQQIVRGSLPCFILSKKPMILASYWEKFYKEHDAIMKRVGKIGPVTFVFQFGWHRETVTAIEELLNEVAQSQVLKQGHRAIFLCNSPLETQMTREKGLESYYCHQNAFINENIYPIHQVKKTHDAIYIARVTPFKRHHLASKISSLLLIGDYKKNEADYAKKTLADLSQATWIQGVISKNISKMCSSARVGLCLSAEEGAMFVSAEYLLSGIPIVNTPNLGGRDGLFSEKHVRTVTDDPQAIKEAVDELVSLKLDPQEIRAAVLEKMEQHRATLRSIIKEVYEKNNVAWDDVKTWKKIYRHKLGLRTTLTPIEYLTKTLRP